MIALWIRSEIGSAPSFIAVSARQPISKIASTSTATPPGSEFVADRGAGVAPDVAEHLDHQIGSAVDDLRHVGELGRAVDEAAQLHDAAHPVEIAAAGDAQMGNDVERAQPRRVAAVGDGDAGAELADMAALAVPLADLARRRRPGCRRP